jgi:signal transduction histidine kinase
LVDGGLRPALRTLAHRSTIPVELDVRVGARLPEPVEVATYYVVAEALTNTAKHANASRVLINVEATDDIISASVRDDDGGGANPARGSGLAGLQDRVEALGGAMSVESPSGSGTNLHVQIPIVAESR